MEMLVAGVVLWSVVHLLPSAGRGIRQGLISTVGDSPYQGLFALSILGSVVLMVFGWRSATPSFVYAPPVTSSMIMSPLMIVALILFAGSQGETNIKRIIRHPQLTGVFLWCLGHLLTNGDDRTIVLFGGIGLWTLVAMVLTNRRDRDYTKPAAVPLKADAKPLIGGVVFFVILVFAHPYISGVSPILN